MTPLQHLRALVDALNSDCTICHWKATERDTLYGVHEDDCPLPAAEQALREMEEQQKDPVDYGAMMIESMVSDDEAKGLTWGHVIATQQAAHKNGRAAAYERAAAIAEEHGHPVMCAADPPCYSEIARRIRQATKEET